MSFRAFLATGVFLLPFTQAACVCFVAVCRPRISPSCPRRLLLIGFSASCGVCVDILEESVSDLCERWADDVVKEGSHTNGPATCIIIPNGLFNGYIWTVYMQLQWQQDHNFVLRMFVVCISPDLERTHIFSVSSAVVLQHIVGALVVDSDLLVSAFREVSGTHFEKRQRENWEKYLTTLLLVPFLLSGNDFSDNMSLHLKQNSSSTWELNSGIERFLIVLVTSWEKLFMKTTGNKYVSPVDCNLNLSN